MEPTKSLSVQECAALLQSGEIAAIPTETVYGLAALARRDDAVAKVFAAKERPAFDPLIAHVSDAAMAEQLTHWSPQAARLAAAFWPGPLTLILPKKSSEGVCHLATSGLATVGVRAPQHPAAHELLAILGESFVAPSANLFGRVSPTCKEHVDEQLSGRIAGTLDGGHCRVGVESTILSLIAEPTLLRHGGIPQEEIENLLGKPVLVQTASNQVAPDSPGLLPSHYAPRQPFTIKEPNEDWPDDPEVARLGYSKLPPRRISPGAGALGSLDQVLSPSGSLEEAASRLFEALHELERGSAKRIVAEWVPAQGIGQAMNDRLRRAAGRG
ncbi:MAG: threonylcarbamoyl-AMP synthase [Polyangiaceae bacterium]|nr:threonylcarbamoyl-AMP synthase [Polyangiaceae bacterium]